MKKLHYFIALVMLTCEICAYAQEKLKINFEYPSLTGDFYVSSKASFPPMTVNSEYGIAVTDRKTGEEIPTKITVTERWPDGCILDAEILFPANTSRKREYVLSYGNETTRKRIFTQAAVLPVISGITGTTPATQETMDINVGEMIIKVDRSPEVRYYWHILPITLLILLSIYRARKSYRLL